LAAVATRTNPHVFEREKPRNGMGQTIIFHAGNSAVSEKIKLTKAKPPTSAAFY
jgi:hypothetical protein